MFSHLKYSLKTVYWPCVIRHSNVQLCINNMWMCVWVLYMNPNWYNLRRKSFFEKHVCVYTPGIFCIMVLMKCLTNANAYFSSCYDSNKIKARHSFTRAKTSSLNHWRPCWDMKPAVTFSPLGLFCSHLASTVDHGYTVFVIFVDLLQIYHLWL